MNLLCSSFPRLGFLQLRKYSRTSTPATQTNARTPNVTPTDWATPKTPSEDANEDEFVGKIVTMGRLDGLNEGCVEEMASRSLLGKAVGGLGDRAAGCLEEPLIGNKVELCTGNKVGRFVGNRLGRSDGEKEMNATGLQEGMSDRGDIVGPRVGMALGELEWGALEGIVALTGMI